MYPRNPRCKICNSPLREEIDAMLSGEELRPDGRPYRYEEILAWARERGLQTSLGALSRHKARHLLPALQAALEAERLVEAVAKATGKELSLPVALANIIVSKAIQELSDRELSEMELDRALHLALRAAEVALKLERLDRSLLKEAAEKVEEKLRGRAVDPEIIAAIKRDLYGL